MRIGNSPNWTAGIPHPSEPWLENPPAIVIWQPAPRLRANKHPIVKKRIEIPISHLKWIPAERNSVGSPAVAIPCDRIPAAVSIKIAKTGIVVIHTGVLPRPGNRLLPGLKPAVHPLIEIVRAG